MAEIITGGRTVKTSMEPVVDFARSLRAKDSAKALEANANLMRAVNLPLYSGRDLPDDKRAQFPGGGDITVNLGKQANVPAKLLDAIGAKQAAPCAYTGNTPEGTPIQIDTIRRMSEQVESRRNCVQMTIDLQAVANVNDIERDKGRAKMGLPTLISGDPKKDRQNPALGRMDVQLSAVNATQGVPAMNEGRLAANLGEMAAQNYLMTTPKSNPGKYMVQKEDVGSVAALYAKEFKSFAEKYAEKDCAGIKAMEKQDDGTFKAGKETIEGTKFSSLKSMGFSPVSLDDGSFALVCTDNSAKAVDARKGPEGLNAFNKAFNSHMSQVTSREFESGSVARNLAAQTSIACYPTTIPGSGMTMIQPSTEFKVRSFARSVTTNVECATHQNIKPVEEIYGKDVLDNTRKIQDYFPDKGGSEGRDKVLSEIKAKVPAATMAKDAPQAANDGPEVG